MRNLIKGRKGSLWLVLAVLAALNVAGVMYFGRLDLSQGDIYTLSEFSRGLVGGLEEPVTVKVFFSEDVGPQFNQNRTYLRDMLDDYRAFSKGRLAVEMVDPKDKEAFEREARRYRIQPLQAQVLENDAFTSRMVFMGLAFLAGDRTETIPVVAKVDGLEYLLTSTLRRLTVPELATVGILQGHGEPPLFAPSYPGMPPAQASLGMLAEALRRDYQVRQVDLTSQAAVPGDLETLLWIKPTAPVDTATLYKLDQFLMRGGRLGLFLDAVDADLQAQQAQPLSLGIEWWLARYGVRLRESLLGDLSCGNVQVRQGGGIMAFFPVMMKYPLFVQVKDFTDGHAISRDLQGAMLFFPSPLDTAAFAAARAAGARVTAIARSSPNSEIQAAPYNLSPLDEQGPQLAERFGAGPQVLAATVEGPLASAFPARPAGLAALDSAGAVPPHLAAATEARLAVVGDGDFLVDGYAQEGNLLLAQNITDWLSLDDGLISIRGKSLAPRPLADLSAGARKSLKWLNMLGVPLVVVAFGLMRWSARRRRSQAA